MKFSFGFSAGAAPRVALAAAWAVIAVAVVIFLDMQTTTRRGASTPASTVIQRPELAEGAVDVRLAAGFRVAQWRVLVGTSEIEASAQDASSWNATIDQVAGHFEIFVEAQSEDLFADHRHALQVILRDGQRETERTIWGDGDVNVLIDVERWLDGERE